MVNLKNILNIIRFLISGVTHFQFSEKEKVMKRNSRNPVLHQIKMVKNTCTSI